jgi:hypothetical protein
MPPTKQQRIKGYIVMALIFGGVIFINSWAFHMGGRWTPTLSWTGFGTLQSSTGSAYGIYVILSPDILSSRRSGGIGGHSNLSGTAWLCNARTDPIQLRVSGSIHSALLDTNGKAVDLRLSNPQGSKPRVLFDLYGTWHEHDLVMRDDGSLDLVFAKDGTLVGYLKTTYTPGEHAEITLQYGDRSEFDAICKQLRQ